MHGLGCGTRSFDNIQALPWQTCTCIGAWHYDRAVYDQNRYKSAATVIRMPVDIVSKIGNLLLNIPVRGDGSIDDQEIKILEDITAWMDINKESIFGTRPWKIYGEGPAADASNPLSGSGFNEGKVQLSEKDIRYNQKGKVLYAFQIIMFLLSNRNFIKLFLYSSWWVYKMPRL